MKQSLLRLFALSILAYSSTFNLTAQCDAPLSSMFATNGLVNTSVYDPINNVYYIGGDFTMVNPFYTQGALLDIASASPIRTLPIVAGGSVLASVSDGAGGLFIAGSFTTVGGLTRNRLAHINSSGQVTAWNPNPDNTVNTIALSGATLYVGGAFTSIGGQSRNNIAALDASTGNATLWNPDANNSVNSIVISGSTVFAGGLFSTIGGQTRNNIAALDASTGNATAWDANADFSVTTLVISGSNLYAGGTFTAIGGQARARIAALDITTGLATAWNPSSSAQVNTILVNGTTVYVGGAFTTIGGQSRNRIAALDITTGLATAWDPNASATVRALAMNGTNVIVGGDFLTIGGQSRNRIAEIDISGLATAFNPNANSSVFTLFKISTFLYVGGALTTIGGVARNRIAAINASTGVATAWNPDVNNSVYALALDGTTLYAGGLFTTVGGAGRNRIAAINTSTGIATSWDPNASASVNALAVDGSIVYAGGTFASIGGQSRTRLAALDKTTGLATSWDPSAGNTVKSIAVSGNSVYIGGLFTTAGGQSRNRIAEIDATTGLATAWNPAASAVVNTLLVSAGTVYVGGAFNTIGGQSRPRLAAINTSDGLATSWNPNPNNLVYALGLSGSTLYVGGTFTSIGGQPRNSLASVNVSDGLATTWNPNVAITIYTLSLGTPSVYIGGDFGNIAQATAYRNSAAFSFGGITVSSQPNNSSICAGASTSFSVSASGVSAYQWQVSTDNGNNWSNVSGGIYSNPNGATLSLNSVTVGYDTYQYRCILSGGSCSSGIPSAVATLTVNETPSITGTTPDTRCDTGELTLDASSSGGTINWYDAASGGTLVGSGSPFVTPTISSTTTYYVEAISGICASPRTAVTATVNITPIITSTTPSTICDSGIGTLEATASSGTITWYDDLTGGSVVATGTSYATPTINSTTTYYLEVTDAGCTSTPRVAIVASVNTSPTITGTTADARCGAGTLTLEATSTIGTINWYDALNGGNLVGTGSPFVTSSIGSTTTYYVEADNNGCMESPRTAVVATVTTIPPSPTNTTPAVDLTICAGSSTVLSVSGVADIGWYDATSGGNYLGGGSIFITPILNSTTSYYVQDSTCGASSRTIITVSTDDIIAPVFTAVSNITQSVDAGQCSAVVTFPAAIANDNCSAVTITSSHLSGDVFVVGTTVVSDTARDASGNTTTRTFTITVVDDELPTITCPADETFALLPGTCEYTGGPLLSPVAADNCGVLNVSNNAPTTFLVGTTVVTWYVMDVNNNVDSCFQNVVITGTPSAPVAPSDITPISNLTICSGNITVLSASGVGSLSWYDDLTGGNYLGAGASYTTNTLTSTTTYYVQDSNCLASDRTAITVTVNPVPSITGTIPDARCDAGTLTLAASTSAGSIDWYDDLTGGNLVGSGTSFTTPVLSSTTTYYVETSDLGCVSNPRVAVIATINDTPSITGTTPDARCDAGTLTLAASTSAGSIDWYDDLTGGNLVGSGTSFTTPVLSSTTTYYVEASNAGCVLNPRVAVDAEITIIDNTVSVNTNSITANQTSAQYQWIDCLAGNAIISGETNQSYAPTVNGTYAVVITLNSCIDTSVCTPIVVSGISTSTGLPAFVVFPNPSSGMFTIQSAPIGVYKIINELGQTVSEFRIENSNNVLINLEGVNNGIYYIIGNVLNQVVRQKIIINN